MPVRVDEAVNAIKAATLDGYLPINYSEGADGLGIQIENWQNLYPVLENLLEQSWFPDSDWVRELIDLNREVGFLRLSQDRLQQLMGVVGQVQERLPIIMEAWSSLVHPHSARSFHVGIELQGLPDLSELTDKLDGVFKLLAVDKSFSVTVSEGFILVVPEGPYTHFCATFALYLAKKSLERIHGAAGREFRDLIKYLPGYTDDPSKDGDVEEAIARWAIEGLEEDWDWFEQVRSRHFPEQQQARANIEKAIPLLCELLKSGQCHIDPPAELPTSDLVESDGSNDVPFLRRAFGQLSGALRGVSRHLSSAESLQRIALNASDLAEKV